MASTRSKNDPGNYANEQRKLHLAREYIHAPHGASHDTRLSELGVTPSHLPRDVLAHNPVDIESRLYGIGASNLASPPPVVYPRLKHIPSHRWFERVPMMMPRRLVTEPNQRPPLW